MTATTPLIRAIPTTDLAQHVWSEPLTVTFHFANETVYNLFVKVILNPSTLIPIARPIVYTVGIVVAATAFLALVALGSPRQRRGESGSGRNIRMMSLLPVIMIVGYLLIKMGKSGSRI